MRLLFLTPQLPYPPHQGTALRNWGLIKSLSARHTITLLTFAGENESITPELRAVCRQIETVPPPHRITRLRLRNLFLSPLPDLAHRLGSGEFSSRLSALLAANRFDALCVEGLELAPYIFTAEYAENAEKKKNEISARAALSAVKIIFDAHNAETLLQRRAFETDLRRPRRWPVALYSFIQSRRLARFEAEACRRVNHVNCVSVEDAAALQMLVPDLKPVIVPNGIFLSDYIPVTRHPSPVPQLVFTGKMDYRPNVDAVTWFATDILPLIQREKPESQFIIVGQKPVEAVQRLSERTGVVVTGAVDDARPYIANATVYVVPLRMGGGTRFKLLEAMALKRPIVSTAIGAEGFAVQHGRELLLADTAAEFADAVLILLKDEAKQNALSTAGYEFVKDYDWEKIVPKVEAIL